MKTYKIPESLAISENGFLFMPMTGETFTLNEIGSAIFRMLQKSKPINEISNLILNEYEINSKTIEKDVQDFIGQLSQFNLVEEL
ncbi:MAG: PqqD family protein [Ignavibacteriae bacterium]|nr:PqqD family protein [Ignavibacteriota bacterium]